MDKKLIVVAPSLPKKPLSRRQVLEGFGALAIPIIGCSSESTQVVASGGAGAGGVAGSGQAGANVAGTFGVGGSGVAGSPAIGGGGNGSMTTTGGGGNMNTAGSSAGSSGSVTGGASPGGGPGAGAGGANGGAAGSAEGGVAGMNGGAGTMGGSGGSGGGMIVIPEDWETVPTASCRVSKTDAAGQGPFMIHDKEKSDDVSLFRQDIRGRYNMDAEAGVEMHYHLRLLDSSSGCMMPVKDVEVYIWHTDGQGFYSGFGMPGDQKPDDPYAGVPNQNDLDNPERFCRGAQLTNMNGIASFRTIFPGWYNGRVVHIHLLILKKDSMSRGRMTYSGGDHLFTTQLYFAREFTQMIHSSVEPYKRRTALSAYNKWADPASEPNSSGLQAKAELKGDIIVSQMQILLNAGA